MTALFIRTENEKIPCLHNDKRIQYGLIHWVTGNIAKRVFEHKNHLVDGFTKKYNVTKLIYTEEYARADDAIKREKQIKAGSRKKKIELIQKINPKIEELKVVGL